MKKLITNINGGMPDLLDNFRWHEAGVIESIEAICRAMAVSRNTYRLFGAVVTRVSTSVSVTKGVIYHNGELFNVEPASFTAPATDTLYWERADHYDPTGQLTFQNAQQHNVYLDRRLVLRHVSGSLPPTAIIANNMLFPLRDALQDGLLQFVSQTEKNLWNNKASTDLANDLSDGLMSSDDKIKLDGVAENANNYIHPATHPASMIVTSSTLRFVTEAERRQANPGVVTLAQANPIWDMNAGLKALLTLNNNRALSFINIQVGDGGILIVTNTGA
ncbi:MAG TPA: hypothetical protein VLH56_17015, partial [Dissulfurispiraceae bacterium]|nr:hypothetical protein [Dissulfurispiraceae bacterium]